MKDIRLIHFSDFDTDFDADFDFLGLV